jgi:hypothetical protein
MGSIWSVSEAFSSNAGESAGENDNDSHPLAKKQVLPPTSADHKPSAPTHPEFRICPDMIQEQKMCLKRVHHAPKPTNMTSARTCTDPYQALLNNQDLRSRIHVRRNAIVGEGVDWCTQD